MVKSPDFCETDPFSLPVLRAITSCTSGIPTKESH
jgi:hypothetical protein